MGMCGELTTVQVLEDVPKSPLHALQHGVYQRLVEPEVFYLGFPQTPGDRSGEGNSLDTCVSRHAPAIQDFDVTRHNLFNVHTS